MHMLLNHTMELKQATFTCSLWLHFKFMLIDHSSGGIIILLLIVAD